MKLRIYFKLIKDFVRIGLNFNGIEKFPKIILKSVRSGTYLDIGCYHPFKESHTSYLYKNGWKGINIDISKETIDMFKFLRPKDLNLNIGLSLKNGKQKAYFEKEISAVSSLDKTYLKNIGRKKKFIRNVKVMTLKKIRETYNIENLDFLKLDCESLDSKIILRSNYNDLKCKYLCIEFLPQEVFGWNYKAPTKINKNYYKNYFIQSKIFKKLDKNFKLVSNYNYAFLLRNRSKIN